MSYICLKICKPAEKERKLIEARRKQRDERQNGRTWFLNHAKSLDFRPRNPSASAPRCDRWRWAPTFRSCQSTPPDEIPSFAQFLKRFGAVWSCEKEILGLFRPVWSGETVQGGAAGLSTGAESRALLRQRGHAGGRLEAGRERS